MGWSCCAGFFTLCFLGWPVQLTGVIERSSVANDEQKLKNVGLATDGPALLGFFRSQTLTANAREKVTKLVGQLGDKSFRIRDKASGELPSLGMIAVPFLSQAATSTDLEVARRAAACLRHIEEKDLRVGVPAAAARLLAARESEGATEVLLDFIPSVENDSVAEEVRAALVVLAVRDGKPAKPLLDALDDPVSARRGIAVETLSRAGLAQQQPEVRRLLHDPDPSVRERAALALALAREKEALPVLIDLLAQLPTVRARQVESVLLRLAGNTAPAVGLGQDDASRSKCRDAWAAWWRAQNGTVDLAQLAGIKPMRGYTLLVMLDAGRVVEVDADNKPRLQIDGLEFPLDAQMLPEDRVLVAEHNANRVTERNRNGDVLWMKPVPLPLVAQRLPNGHTFIATQTQFFEVDAAGRVLKTRALPSGEFVMKAQMLDNGDIACVTSVVSASRFVRFDAAGKEIQTMPVFVQTSGGRIDVLPNGNVLVPELKNNRVVEYDPDGKIAWQVPFNEPVAAVRLANGNTLVTSFNQARAVELDRTGREVWDYKTDTRVTRAFRR
jgi:hypothetical protein